MLPDSLSLDATPSEDSPQRQGRPRRSNGPQQGRSEGSYKPNAGYRGPGNRYNRNPREKPKVIMVSYQLLALCVAVLASTFRVLILMGGCSCVKAGLVLACNDFRQHGNIIIQKAVCCNSQKLPRPLQTMA